MLTTKEKYKGEERVITTRKTRDSMTTNSTTGKILTHWDDVLKLIVNTRKSNEDKIEFVLWNNGNSHGLDMIGKQQETHIFNSCAFEMVKNLFIRNLAFEKIDCLSLKKKRGMYQASYSVNYNSFIKKYTYVSCDVDNLKDFFSTVEEIVTYDSMVPNKELYRITNEAKQDIKTYKKNLLLPIQNYKARK